MDCFWVNSNHLEGLTGLNSWWTVPAICSLCESWSEIPSLLKPSSMPGIIFQKMCNFILQMVISCPKTSEDLLYNSPIGTFHMVSLPTTDTSHTTGWTRSYGPSVRAAYTLAKTFSRTVSCFATHLKLTVLSFWILMWDALIPEMAEAHQYGASLSMVRCTKCDNSVFKVK